MGLGQYLHTEHFSALSVKNRDFFIRIEGLIFLMTYGAFNLWKCSWRPLRKLKLKTAIDVPYARYSEEMVYAQRLDQLYLEV